MKRVHDALMLLAMKAYYRDKDYDRTERIARDMFHLGWHLMTERGHVNLVIVGLEIQTRAQGLLQGLYDPNQPKQDADAVKVIYGYQSDLDAIRSLYHSKLEIVHSPSPHAGDVFNIAENDQDHAWRVQAVITLGIVQHTAGRSDDRRYARRLIERYAASDDAVLAAAARAAGAFTDADRKNYTAPWIDPGCTWPPGVSDD
jgi:hypothetical protein